MEFAWSEVVKDAPMMANPTEYRTMVYELFWNGNAPQPRETADGKEGRPVVTPKKALDDLAALKEMAKSLRQAEPDS